MERGTRLLLPLELARTWKRVAADAELGYQLVEASADELVYGLAVGYTVAPFDLLGECPRTWRRTLGEAGVVCGVEGRGDLGRRFRWLAALGARLLGPGSARPDLRLYLGLQTLVGAGAARQ